jgi:hypothetical protein
MSLQLLMSALTSPVNINIPTIDLTTVLVRLIAVLPLVGGFLLAREGRGNLLWEILAVLLLVLATVMPTEPTLESLPSVLNSFLGRTPVALLLIGLAFVRDGGIKMIIGLGLILLSGFVLLPK